MATQADRTTNAATRTARNLLPSPICGEYVTLSNFGQNVFCCCPEYGLPRLQVAGRNKKNQGALHWVCATGTCDMYAEWLDDGGNVCVLDPHGIACWIKAGVL
jgi:hypothetical protein